MSQPNEDAAATLTQVRSVLAAFDWEHDDRQFALERIERIVTVDKPGPYTVALTAGQIFSFAALVRRLGVVYYPQDGPSVLRRELVDALNEFVDLLPDPSEEDGDAYLAAMAAGQVPNWDGDLLPLTETGDELTARRQGAGGAR